MCLRLMVTLWFKVQHCSTNKAEMRVCVVCGLLLSVALIVTLSAFDSSELDVSTETTESAWSCPARWLLFGQRCYAFYPVWSTWSTAEFLCLQTGSNLLSLQTPEEILFVHQMLHTPNPVWVGGYRLLQNTHWFWSDGSPSMNSHWTNQRTGSTGGGGACMQMKSGEQSSAPCGELKFYICATRASFSPKVPPKSRTPAKPEMVPFMRLYNVLWGQSEVVVEEIFRSSSLLRALRSGQLTESCYNTFIQQEALYLQRVSGTLQVLISTVKESSNITALLLDTIKHYSSTNQSLLDVPSPQWLVLSLQSFHSVVLEDPVYWLVALSARAHLRAYLKRKLVLAASPQRRTVARMSSHSSPRGLFSRRKGPGPVSASDTSSLYQQWSRDSMVEAAWAHRYSKTVEEYQQQMDVYKAVNIFRQHIMNQRSFYKAVSCDAVDDADED